MAVKMFKHNSAAYISAYELMNKTGKAAVIHPTGTGKSFIGFKLCEDHPDSTVCWLSPSEYIFCTQKENWIAAGGKDLTNIYFVTYAKLMLMSSSELESINPTYIVLDEFHRCGAHFWGQGVGRLINMYKSAKLLGLSATNIRYLDNRRDMADELFGGNIASEISLGEAIVRGILNPPKYVLSVFSYQKELEKYEARISSVKNEGIRNRAEKYIDSLKRALEKADGLEELFSKHIADKNGKYIVFCANFEHMREMIKKAPEWFSKIDKAPHIYSAYSSSPDTSAAFSNFKSDESRHLKLLYCIDMLNEGIHVEDISGVILLRPTISPIIYKQQIGRALSASKKNNAVIFDIVLNIENLLSVGEIEEEMQIAMTYYLSHGMEKEIVNESFKVIDEVKDCIALFNKLTETLSASWDLMYEAAKKYAETNGNLDVPKRFITKDGLSLGTWICTQRGVYSKRLSGILTNEQIERLNSIGMRWQSIKDEYWKKNFAAAQKYYEEYGNLIIRKDSGKYLGVDLYRWLSKLRTYKKNNIKSAYLTPDRISQLNTIGMIWDVPDYIWEQNYNASVQYHRLHGNLKVPPRYVSPDGIRLGSWLSKIRSLQKNFQLTKEQIEKLDELGMNWELKKNNSWKKSYEAAVRYQKEHGDLNISYDYISDDGCNLGRWIRRQRDLKGSLPAERREMLDKIGMVWDKEIKNIKHESKPYESKIDILWDKHFKNAEAFYIANGNLNIPKRYIGENGDKIGVWLQRQRSGRRRGMLKKEQIQMLDNIGMIWEFENPWERGYSHAKEYFEKHGNLNVSGSFVCADGFPLGKWLYSQRSHGKRLPDDRLKMLLNIGMAEIG